jgi:hypothetical protein
LGGEAKEFPVNLFSIWRVVRLTMTIGTQSHAVPHSVAFCGAEDMMDLDETGVASRRTAAGSFTDALTSLDDSTTNTRVTPDTRTNELVTGWSV